MKIPFLHDLWNKVRNHLTKPLVITVTILAGVTALNLVLLLAVPSVRYLYSGDYTYDISPTCTQDGYRISHSHSGLEYPVGRFLATDHSYVTSVTPPTCTQNGYTTHVCTVCHDVYRDAFTPPTGHTFRDTVVSPTCTDCGYTTHVCSTCGLTVTDTPTPPANHTYTYLVTPPDCTHGGYTSYTCTVCGYSYTDNITPPLEHDFVTTTVKPTCTKEGYTSLTCSRCGESSLLSRTPATGHHYSQSTVPATCTEQGCQLHTCPDCGDQYVTNVVAALGHSYTQTIHYATKTKIGGTTHTCTRCNDTFESSAFTWNDVFDGRQGDGKGTLTKGVDLSYHNQTVNFQNLKKAGISFVILRVGTSNGKDSGFEAYYTAAKAAGLSVGAYVYSYATSPSAARADASRVLSWLSGKQLDYPVFFDMEDTTQKALGKDQLTNIVLAFCDAMTENGWYPGLYTNKTWAGLLDMPAIASHYDVWLASWVTDGTNISDYSNDYSLWQYSATGRLSGVTTDVDLDACFRDYPTYIRSHGYNGYQG